MMILREINERLLEEQRENNANTGKGTNQKKSSVIKSGDKRSLAAPNLGGQKTGIAAESNVSEVHDSRPVMIFRKIYEEKM